MPFKAFLFRRKSYTNILEGVVYSRVLMMGNNLGSIAILNRLCPGARFFLGGVVVPVTIINKYFGYLYNVLR